jgi:predicted O-methyltransferase YrrM
MAYGRGRIHRDGGGVGSGLQEPEMTNRQDLARYFYERGFHLGVEVGVCHGVYAEQLLQANPGLTLYGVDSWRRGDACHRMHERLADQIASRRFHLLSMKSLKAVEHFADGALDFVFIDADHREAEVYADLVAWTPKVRLGGIVSGHDYFLHKGGVVAAVDRFVREQEVQLKVIPRDGQNPEKDSHPPCWWFER